MQHPGSSQQIRYGIVGVGMMGQEHLRNIAALPDASVVAVADPHAESLAQATAIAQDTGGTVATYEDVAAMVRSESSHARRR